MNQVALDFGAGSLRDSYELSKSGFRVVSVDLDEAILVVIASLMIGKLPIIPKAFLPALESLARQTGPDFFHLAIAFDVMSILKTLLNYCRQISSLLHEQGMLSHIVPNRRSLFERYFRYTQKGSERRRSANTRCSAFAIQDACRVGKNFLRVRLTNSRHEMAIGFLSTIAGWITERADKLFGLHRY